MAGGIDWFRWHHGSVTDPKFQLVARRSGQGLGNVIAVWAFVLETASAAQERGIAGDIDDEAIDCMLGMAGGATEAILHAMRDRGLLDDHGHVVKWHQRQPKREREDDKSTERVRAFREKQRTETPGNATERQETPRGEESREEHAVAKATDGKPSVDKSRKPKSPADRAKADLWKAAVAVLDQGGCSNEAMARSFMGKLVTDYGLDAVRLAVDAAVTSQPADAREYLKATCQRHKGERRDPVTVPSDAAEKTAAMLAARQMTPEERAASDEARRRVMSAIRVVA